VAWKDIMGWDGDLETVVFTTDAENKIVVLYKTLDTLREQFVLKDGRLAFMYTNTADRPYYNGLQRGLLGDLLTAAGIEEFPLYSSTVYDSAEKQEADVDDRQFFSGV
jgi:hypothetical protein